MKIFILVNYRKNAIFLIIAPYLINVRKLSYQESFNIIKDWLLNKCNKLERLDPVILRYKLKSDLDKAVKVRYKPINLEKIRERNRQLYEMLLSSSHNNNA